MAGNVSASLNKAGVPYKLCGKVTQMFAHLIDFKRDVKKGDTFNVKYEVNKASDGEVVSVGDVIFASFTVNGRTHKLYRYKPRGGTADYYDEKGGAKKTGLDKKPMAMRNARISSLFGYRRHPIYKTTKFHSGVDYAAPRGTAIYASGAGTIEMARYVNGYGNFIKIRHNSEYETAYGHMQKFAAGMRPGVRVKKGQIIGYVGSTGRSTGPHLHFEILRKGQRIDPLKAKVATGNDLTGNQLAEFKRIVKKVDNIKASELVSTEKKKEAAEAKKEAAAENAALKQKETVSESAKTAAGTAENKTSEAKAAEKQANENKTAENKAAAPKTAVTIPQKEDLLASSVKPESRESAANNTVQSNKKPVYPAKTPARKKQNTKVTNANSLKVVRSISRKPKK